MHLKKPLGVGGDHLEHGPGQNLALAVEVPETRTRSERWGQADCPLGFLFIQKHVCSK